MTDGDFRRHPAMIGLRQALVEADDRKLMRIMSLVESANVPTDVRQLFDPVRPRLAALRPPRPLRFSRLLFMPCDGIIVPAPDWRIGDPTVPRSAIAAIESTVRDGLSDGGSAVDAVIEGYTTGDTDIVEAAGADLWPAAGEILGKPRDPIGWDDTGLPASAWPTLSRAVAAVLHRAVRFRSLVADAAIGVVGIDEDAIKELVAGLAEESAEGCATMVVLILLHMPRAAAMLKHTLTKGRDAAETAILHKALEVGSERTLAHLESTIGADDPLTRSALDRSAEEARRLFVLLDELENEASSDTTRHRAAAARGKLDKACRMRFAAGVADNLIGVLASETSAVGSDTQDRLELVARSLRSLEAVARRVGGAAIYDSLLAKARDAVDIAAASGVLTPMRRLRLVELLSGADAAEELMR